MIYLDNAATSFPKPEAVYMEMDRCMREYCANPGRGGHVLSLKAGMAVMEARNSICRLFNIPDPLRLAFAKNATEAINMAVKGTVTRGCHIITTGMEHNSVMRPLMTAERDMGADITIVKGNDLGEIEPDSVKKEIRGNTALIVCTLSSNVNGVIMPIGEIGRIAREAGVRFLLDASQGAGSLEVDTEKQSVDLLAFPGHKGLLGPQGTGGLYVRSGIDLKPLMEGGTGSNSDHLDQPGFMPDLLESGTLNTPGIAGLACGVNYILDRGRENIRRYKQKLTGMLFDGLRCIPGIKLYCPSGEGRNSGIVAVNLWDMDSSELSYILDREFGICTRAGLHCAPGAHRILGTLKRGIVRFSLSCLNTEQEIIQTIEAVEKISGRSGNF